MIETQKPEMTVDTLVERMRAVAAGSRTPAVLPDRSAASNRVAALLDVAARVARSGSTFPPLAPFRGLLRYPARWAASLVLYLSRFITDAQATFNVNVLHALRDLNDSVSNLQLSARSALDSQPARRLIEDAFALKFHDHFRGPPEMIRHHLSVYLPLMHAALAQTCLPALDLGCGRGEWLELLRDEHWVGRGVDTHPAFVLQCRQRGLDVVTADAIEYLRSQPDARLGAVTAFHLLEHLPFPDLVQLVDEVVRVLHPGGVAIFETPNPENLLVGSYRFYQDPTHQKPLPSTVIKFVAESRGLSDVEVMYLHPSPDALPADGSPLTDRFNALIYGPQDYAVVGRKR